MAPIDRRRALLIFGWVAGALASVEAAWATLRFARAPVSYGPPRRWSLGPPETYAAGATAYDEQAAVFVKRDGKGLRALTNFNATLSETSYNSNKRVNCVWLRRLTSLRVAKPSYSICVRLRVAALRLRSC